MYKIAVQFIVFCMNRIFPKKQKLAELSWHSDRVLFCTRHGRETFVKGNFKQIYIKY